MYNPRIKVGLSTIISDEMAEDDLELSQRICNFKFTNADKKV